jgi:ketopantoate hydroxymethyltransferase
VTQVGQMLLPQQVNMAGEYCIQGEIPGSNNSDTMHQFAKTLTAGVTASGLSCWLGAHHKFLQESMHQ